MSETQSPAVQDQMIDQAAHLPSDPSQIADEQQSELENSDQFKIVAVDQTSLAKDRASDIADDEFNKKVAVDSPELVTFGESRLQRVKAKIWNIGRAVKHQGKEVVQDPKAAVTRMWVQTFDGYYTQKIRRETFRQTLATGNIFMDREDGQEATEALNATTVQRFLHRDADKLISQDQGERIEKLDDKEDGPEKQLHKQLVSLASKIATGELTEDTFDAEAQRTLRALAKDNPELLGKGELFATNLLDVARNVAKAVDHLEGEERLDQLDAVLAQVETYAGISASGQRTEARYTKADKIVAALDGSEWKAAAGAATVASVTFAVGKAFAQKGVGKAAAMTGVFGAAGAVLAGSRRSKQIADDRAQHGRDRAAGEEFNENAKRRSVLEEARYETVAASDLYSGLQDMFEGEGVEAKLKDLDQEQFMHAMGLLSQVQVRNELSDAKNLDFVHFSDVTKIEEERFELLQTEVFSEDALKKLFEEKGLDWLKQAGILDGDQFGDEIETFEDLLEAFNQDTTAFIEQDMTSRDKTYAKIRRSEIKRAAITGAIVGGTAGVLFQEVFAVAPGIGSHTQGIFESHAQPGQKSTLLAGLLNREHGPGFSGDVTEVGGHGRFANVDGFTPHQDAKGNWFIQQDAGGKKVNLNYLHDGTLTPDSKSRLAEMGFNVHSDLATPELSGATHNVVVGHNTFALPQEYNVSELSPGHWAIVGQKGEVVHNLNLNFDGSLTQEGINQLQRGGIGVTDASNLVDTTTAVPGHNAASLVQNHLAETRQVHRTLWYGNDTPSPNYDLNELRTHAGGVGGGWYDEQGNVVLDVSAMTAHGSFQGGQSVNPFLATGEGHLSLAVSASKDTQSSVFDFNFTTTPDGRTIATIPPGSPVHQMFQMDGSKRTFTGAYFEVMEHTGVMDAKGEQVKILGTYVGQNNASNLTDVVHTTQAMHNTTLNIIPPPEHINLITYEGQAPLVEAAPFIPVGPRRRGLEVNEEPIVSPKTTDAPGRTPSTEIDVLNRPSTDLDVINELERNTPSTELELYGDRLPTRYRGSGYKKRDLVYVPRTRQELEFYDASQVPKPTSKPNDTPPTPTSSEPQQTEGSIEFVGRQYSRAEMAERINSYLTSVGSDSPLAGLLNDQAVDSPSAFVSAVEKRLEELSRDYTENGKLNQSGIRREIFRLFPDSEFFSTASLVSVDDRGFEMVDETLPNGDTRTIRRAVPPRLVFAQPVVRDILELMYEEAKKK